MILTLKPSILLVSLSPVMWIVVIRYQQVRDLGDQCRRANLAALVLGFIAASGVSILGSFPVLSLSLSLSLSSPLISSQDRKSVV